MRVAIIAVVLALLGGATACGGGNGDEASAPSTAPSVDAPAPPATTQPRSDPPPPSPGQVAGVEIARGECVTPHQGPERVAVTVRNTSGSRKKVTIQFLAGRTQRPIDEAMVVVAAGSTEGVARQYAQGVFGCLVRLVVAGKAGTAQPLDHSIE